MCQARTLKMGVRRRPMDTPGSICTGAFGWLASSMRQSKEKPEAEDKHRGQQGAPAIDSPNSASWTRFQATEGEEERHHKMRPWR